MSRIIPKLIPEYIEQNHLSREKIWFIWSEGLKEEYKKFAEEEAKKNGIRQIKWVKTGGVITTHGGPGAFGVVGLKEAF